MLIRHVVIFSPVVGQELEECCFYNTLCIKCYNTLCIKLFKFLIKKKYVDSAYGHVLTADLRTIRDSGISTDRELVKFMKHDTKYRVCIVN